MTINRKSKPEEVFYLNQLQSWWPYATKERGERNYTIKTIAFFFPDQKLSIGDSDIDELEDYLTKNHFELMIEPKGPPFFKKLSDVMTLIGAILIFIIGPVMAVTSIEKIADKNKGSDIKDLGRLVLSDSPQFISHSNKGSDDTYEMRLKTQEIRDFKLVLKNIGHKDEKAIIERNLNKNDTIDACILQYDYDIKVAKTKNPSFGDKHFNWHTIKLKGIHSSVINL